MASTRRLRFCSGSGNVPYIQQEVVECIPEHQGSMFVVGVTNNGLKVESVLMSKVSLLPFIREGRPGYKKGGGPSHQQVVAGLPGLVLVVDPGRLSSSGP